MGGNWKARGTLGEDIAVKWLTENGYEILERNWRAKCGELDIVARKDFTIAFVEVKLRASDGLASPLLSVTRAQRRRIVKTAVLYLKSKGSYNTGEFQPRFDVFEVETDPNSSEIVTRCGILPGAYDMEGLGVFL